jgi:hypothetical protein
VRAVAVTALSVALLAAGCGSTSSKPAGLPPTADRLVRSSLDAAAAAPGAQYELIIDAKLDGKLPKSLHKYVTGEPHVRAIGTVGPDLFTSHVTSSIPTIALLTGDEVRAGPTWAYLRYQSTWYGTGREGLRRFWPILPRLVVPPQRIGSNSVKVSNRDDLYRLLTTAIAGRVAAGPSLDGTDTWELSGKLRPQAIRAVFRIVFGDTLPLTNLRVFAARSRAVFDAGREDRLPRRVRFDFTLLSSDLPSATARQVPDVHRADVVVELDLAKWGKQAQPQRPPSPHSFGEYLQMTGLGR